MRDFELPGQTDAFQTKSVLLSLISIFQTSIYFPLASQDQNSAELIIKALPPSAFIFLPTPLPPLKATAAASKFSRVSSWTQVKGGRSVEALSLRYTLIAYTFCIKWSIWNPSEGTHFCFSVEATLEIGLAPSPLCRQSSVSYESSSWNLMLRFAKLLKMKDLLVS